MEIEYADGILTIRIPTHAPVPSASGKTYLVASETKRNVSVDGRAVTVAVNAYTKDAGR